MLIHKHSTIVYKPNYNHDSKCHFCKKNRIEEGSELIIEIEDKNLDRYVIYVPRCKKCKNRHKKKTNFSVLGIISSLLFYIMLVGSAATISGITAGVAAFFGLGLACLIYYICRLIEDPIVNGGYDEPQDKSMIELDELKMLCDSDFSVNNKHKDTEDDVYYCVNVLSQEKLDKLETVYNYVRRED